MLALEFCDLNKLLKAKLLARTIFLYVLENIFCQIFSQFEPIRFYYHLVLKREPSGLMCNFFLRSPCSYTTGNSVVALRMSESDALH